PQETPDRFHALKADELQDERGETIEAYLPTAYVSEARLRIDLYRRLAMASNLEQVQAVTEELSDRFGAPPEPVGALLKMTEIRVRAEQKRISAVETLGNRLQCRRAETREPSYLQVGNRFPRLTEKKPLAKLTEISNFLARLPGRAS
ncbi:MAG: TRCF domain-containing protein, partial [Verrucomicrobiota bacterium]